MPETPVISSILMDRSEPLGNSLDVDSRRALHTKIKNTNSEPIPISAGQFSVPQNAACYTYSTGTSGIYFTESYAFYQSGTPAAPVGLIKTITLYYFDAQLTQDAGGAVS